MSNGKGDSRRPTAISADTFAARWAQTFAARRELTTLLQGRCKTCHGEGRDPDHHKNACPACGGDGKLKEAA